MNGWNDGIADAVNYIEEHLTDELDIVEISAKTHVSSFYFQKIFHVLCGFTVGEYIRNRRLTLAGQELAATELKVVDAAVKYGYDSPDSFTRAFTKFHGITPSAAREKGARLNSFAPLRIKLTLEGGTIMEYRIVSKAQFTVMGRTKRINYEMAYEEIPKFWEEHRESEQGKSVCGMYGICIGIDGKDFDYIIADNYQPWNEVPEECDTKAIPGGTWAVFPCKGALPKSLQEVNTKIWSEWLPSCKAYKLAGNYNIEMYTPPTANPDDYYCEIWIPVEEA